MQYTYLIILLALIQYIFFSARVGFNRGKLEVSAPNTKGNPLWESMFRVQQNTMEQLIIFIPGMLLFHQYVSAKWVLLPGVLFVIGRQIYSHLYLKDPSSRGPGFVLSFFSNVALIIGAVIGLGMDLI